MFILSSSILGFDAGGFDAGGSSFCSSSGFKLFIVICQIT